MKGVSNAQLAAAVNDVVARGNARDAQLADWLAGSPTGGPNGNGTYPLSDYIGNTRTVSSPAKLEALVTELVSDADGALLQTTELRDEVLLHLATVELRTSQASASATAAATSKNEADTFRQQAASSEANALVHRNAASGSATAAAASATLADERADAADASATAAAASAAAADTSATSAASSAILAATFDPANFYTKTEANTLLAAKLAIVDFTWANLADKPTTFTPSAHTHIIADVTGLQAALDGKQAAGSYAAAVHSHVIADVTGLQAALDAKLATVDFTWTNLADKPTTFAPSAHTHVIADVTGLQAALDGKQAAGSYAAAVHTHVIADVTGLQTALDGKQPTGAYLTGITSGMVTTALGYTPANRAGDTFTGLVTVSGSGLNAAVRLSNTTGGRDWRVMQKDAGFLAITDETAGAERFNISSAGIVTVPVDVRTPVVYDLNDTSFYVDPSGGSRLNTLGVVTEVTYPGSMNGDYASGYYHFGPSDGTPTGGYGHAHIIRLSADWNVQMFFPTSNTNEPFWLRRKQSGTYASWRRMLQEDEWIGNKYLASDGRIYGTIFYDANDGAYYLDPNGTSRLNTVNASSLYSYGNVTAEGDMIVGNGKTASYIYMGDTDEGQRIIHNNSNRIGFLTQAGGWGAWCEDDGTWSTDTACNAPIFYDRNDSAYYLNPNGTTSLNQLVLSDLITGRSSSATDVNAANDTGSLSVRGSTTTVAAMSFHRTGAYAINMGLGTDAVFRIGGWSAASNCFQMDGNGNLTMLGNVTAYSDARLKTDVETITGALDMVSAMRGVRYTRIDSGQRQVGVIAQEMQGVVPEVVHQGVGDDDTLSVAYANLVGVLIEAIKELRSEVHSLKGN